MPTTRAIGLLFIAVLSLTGSVMASNSPADGAPTNSSIQIAQELRGNIEQMLRRSTTFRSQYQRIVETPGIIVGINLDATLCGTAFRARTTFRRYASGLMIIAISIGPGPHQAEWIAHEFEHILEQLEGRDLKRLAAKRSRDVWYSAAGVFETTRAERAGRVVLEEVRQRRNQPAGASFSSTPVATADAQ